MGATGPHAKGKSVSRIEEYIVIVAYLWVVFGILTLHKSLILSEHHIDFASHGFALINALCLVKVMLVAKDVRLGSRLDGTPIIYPVVLKSVIFAILLAFFKILEDAAVDAYRGTPFQQSIVDLGGTWRGISVLTVLICFLLVPFVGFMELQRVLGERKLEQIFFQTRRPK